jgi:hypothetical protein
LFLKSIILGILAWIDDMSYFGPFILKERLELKELYVVEYLKNSKGS